MADHVAKFELDKALEERDLGFLSEQVSNSDLTPEVRQHLASIIRGLLTREIKFPNHRPPASSSSKNTWKIALRVVALRREGWGKISAAVKQVATEFECSDGKVWTCLREFRKILREVDVWQDYRDTWGWHDDWEERRAEERAAEEARQEEELREEALHEEALWEELLEEERLKEEDTTNKL